MNGKTHHKTKELFEPQKKLIDYLRGKGAVKRTELVKHLELNFLKHPENTKEHQKLKKKFYRLLSPLLNWIVISESGNGDISYRVSYDAFKANIEAIKKSAMYYFEKK